MRRTASQVLRQLEARVALLEKGASSDGPDLSINSSNAYHHPHSPSGAHTTAMLFDPRSKKKWEAVLDGKTVTVSQGVIEGKSKKSKKSFDNEIEAEDHYRRILTRKLRDNKHDWTSTFNAQDGNKSLARKHRGPNEVMYGRYPTPDNLQERHHASALPALKSALDELEGMAIPALMENDVRSAEKHIQQALVMTSNFNGHEEVSTSLFEGISSVKQGLMSGSPSRELINSLTLLVERIRPQL